MSELNSSQRIGKYEILGTLGRGSMGLVYKARDPEIGRIVAIKTLRRPASQNAADFERTVDRFRIEAKSAGNLRHPNIITVFDISREGDMPYLVMDYVEGESLESVLKRHARLDPRITLHYLDQVAAGLDAAHMKGVIHRDIKPSNIIVDRYENVLILDFGVAGFTERFGDEVTPQTGPVLGTPAYMSPEQIRNEKLDHRSDLFSLAIVTFECLTGSKPFDGGNFTAVIGNILSAAPASLTSLVPDLPLDLQAVFETALAKDRTKRFPSGKVFIEACKNACGLHRDEIKTTLETGRGPKRKKQPSYWRSLWEEEEKPSGVPPKPADIPDPGSVEDPVISGAAARAQNPDLVRTLGVGASGGGGVPPSWGARTPPAGGGAAAWLPSTPPSSAGALFQSERRTLSGNSVLALSRARRLRRLTLGIGLLCILLSATIGLLLFAGPPPGSTTAGVNPANPYIFEEGGETNGAEPSTWNPSISVAPVPEGKSVFEMTDQELLGVLTGSDIAEDMVLKALREAKNRSLPDLVDASRYPLQNDSYLVRAETIKILAEIGDKRIVPVLVESLDDYDDVVRIEAAKTLGKLGDKRALGYLSSRMVSEEHTPTREAIKAAIDAINGFSVE